MKLPRHTLPHLALPDVAVSLAGMDLSVRQLTLVLASALIGVNLFAMSAGIETVVGPWLHWFITGFPMVCILCFGWIKVAGKPLEHYFLVQARYLVRPRLYLWRSLWQLLKVEEHVKGQDA